MMQFSTPFFSTTKSISELTTIEVTAIVFGLLAVIAGITLWLWLLIDCSRRKFNNNLEKAAWIAVMIFVPFISQIAYLVVIKLNNKQGIFTA